MRHQQLQKALNLTQQESISSTQPIYNKRKSSRLKKLPHIHDDNMNTNYHDTLSDNNYNNI